MLKYWSACFYKYLSIQKYFLNVRIVVNACYLTSLENVLVN